MTNNFSSLEELLINFIFNENKSLFSEFISNQIKEKTPSSKKELKSQAFPSSVLQHFLEHIEKSDSSIKILPVQILEEIFFINILPSLARKIVEENYKIFLKACKNYNNEFQVSFSEELALLTFTDSLSSLKLPVSRIAKSVFLPEATCFLYQKQMQEDPVNAIGIIYNTLKNGPVYLITLQYEFIQETKIKVDSQNHTYLYSLAIKRYLEKKFNTSIKTLLKNKDICCGSLLYKIFMICANIGNLKLIEKIWDAISNLPADKVDIYKKPVNTFEEAKHNLIKMSIAEAFNYATKNNNLKLMHWLWHQSNEYSKGLIFEYASKRFLADGHIASRHKEFFYSAYISLNLKNKVYCQASCICPKLFFRELLPSSPKDILQLLDEFLIEIVEYHLLLESDSLISDELLCLKSLPKAINLIFEEYNQHYDDHTQHQTLLSNCVSTARLNFITHRKVSFHSPTPEKDTNINYKEKILHLDLDLPLSAKKSNINQNIKEKLNELAQLILKYIYTEGSKMLKQLELKEADNLKFLADQKQEKTNLKNIMT